jgi:hypothetical protein
VFRKFRIFPVFRCFPDIVNPLTILRSGVLPKFRLLLEFRLLTFRLFGAFRNSPFIDLPVGKSSALPADIDLPVGKSSALPGGIDLPIGKSSAPASTFRSVSHRLFRPASTFRSENHRPFRPASTFKLASAFRPASTLSVGKSSALLAGIDPSVSIGLSASIDSLGWKIISPSGRHRPLSHHRPVG